MEERAKRMQKIKRKVQRKGKDRKKRSGKSETTSLKRKERMEVYRERGGKWK